MKEQKIDFDNFEFEPQHKNIYQSTGSEICFYSVNQLFTRLSLDSIQFFNSFFFWQTTTKKKVQVSSVAFHLKLFQLLQLFFYAVYSEEKHLHNRIFSISLRTFVFYKGRLIFFLLSKLGEIKFYFIKNLVRSLKTGNMFTDDIWKVKWDFFVPSQSSRESLKMMKGLSYSNEGDTKTRESEFESEKTESPHCSTSFRVSVFRDIFWFSLFSDKRLHLQELSELTIILVEISCSCCCWLNPCQSLYHISLGILYLDIF